jgi:uncharacterized beta-barrel protein YwiB (DUF1934 family)
MKDVIISITGVQHLSEGDADSIEFVTDGNYKYNGEQDITLSYKESELTGMEGTVTLFEVVPEGVVMSRTGNVNTRMFFEEGKKHLFLYETPYGVASMGVNTRKIHHNLSPHGGDMEIDYIVDVENNVIGHNQFKINVREAKGTVEYGESD